jgi:hypothetical protein
MTLDTNTADFTLKQKYGKGVVSAMGDKDKKTQSTQRLRQLYNIYYEKEMLADREPLTWQKWLAIHRED